MRSEEEENVGLGYIIQTLEAAPREIEQEALDSFIDRDSWSRRAEALFRFMQKLISFRVKREKRVGVLTGRRRGPRALR